MNIIYTYILLLYANFHLDAPAEKKQFKAKYVL